MAALPSLLNQRAWVVGGVGAIGQGITRALLRAGATVVVNSRSDERLAVLSDALGHPERLICLNESMLPQHAGKTVASAMERVGGKLDHGTPHRPAPHIFFFFLLWCFFFCGAP